MSVKKKVTTAGMAKLLLDLNKLVLVAGGDLCALLGLEVVTRAFAALLDIYAAPNAENPQGMCDDRLAFRRHFADLLVSAPALKPRRRKKAA
jgi:hypothetical protein